MTLRRRSYVEAAACPVRTIAYGGMPSGGGYGSAKELEVGAQAIAEAAHCILGSLGRFRTAGKEDWASMARIERGHLKEELGIIQRAVKEYSKDLYLDQINYPTRDIKIQYRAERKAYVKKAIDNIRAASPGLRGLAKKMARQLIDNKKGMPQNVLNAALSAYAVIANLARAMEETVAPWPAKLHQSPFKDAKLRAAVGELSRHVGLLLKGELGDISK